MNFSNASKNKLKKDLGFTLIELLVVISIISLLSTIILSSINDVRAKARDTQRIQELKEVQKALELYYFKYGCYPKSSSNASGASSLSNPCPTGNSALVATTCSSNNTYFNNSLKVLVDAGYLSKLPVDPINENRGSKEYCYNYTRHEPATSAYYCGDLSRTDYNYSISFSVENSNFDLLESSVYDYCMVGDIY
ncbi:type II secretion system protein [Candidatus Parcubacteria bacterium]|nr:type II secretion system protein [Candidatus Parcubacteria bacterium]